MGDDKHREVVNQNSRWGRVAHWLMVDILPVVGLLLLMAWGMGLMSAEAGSHITEEAAVATINTVSALRN